MAADGIPQNRLSAHANQNAVRATAPLVTPLATSALNLHPDSGGNSERGRAKQFAYLDPLRPPDFAIIPLHSDRHGPQPVAVQHHYPHGAAQDTNALAHLGSDYENAGQVAEKTKAREILVAAVYLNPRHALPIAPQAHRLASGYLLSRSTDKSKRLALTQNENRLDGHAQTAGALVS